MSGAASGIEHVHLGLVMALAMTLNLMLAAPTGVLVPTSTLKLGRAIRWSARR